MSAWVLVLIMDGGSSFIKAIEMPNKASCEIAQRQFSGKVNDVVCVNRGIRE